MEKAAELVMPAFDIAALLGHKDGSALALNAYVHPRAQGLRPRRHTSRSGRPR